MWYLIFEQETRTRAPGTVLTSAGPAGAGEVRRSPYRTFKNLMLVEVHPEPDREPWDQALEIAVKTTGRLGIFAAVPCEVFIQEMLDVRAKRGTDGTEGTG